MGNFNKNVILSSPMLLNDGTFERMTISKEQALDFINNNDCVNYVGHETVRILGLEPAKTREVCTGYMKALCLKPIGRLDFGKEYTQDELEAIGVEFVLIEIL